MSSKRHLRRKACENKRKFPSQEAAFACLRKFPRPVLAVRSMRIYRCQFCGGFHIGHESLPTNRHKERRNP
jgi:hypothetical protein